MSFSANLLWYFLNSSDLNGCSSAHKSWSSPKSTVSSLLLFVIFAFFNTIPAYSLLSALRASLFLSTVSVFDVVEYSISLNLSILSFSRLAFNPDALTFSENKLFFYAANNFAYFLSSLTLSWAIINSSLVILVCFLIFFLLTPILSFLICIIFNRNAIKNQN